MKITRRAFLQLPVIAGITLAANKAFAFAQKPLVMGNWVEVDRFYRKINGTNEKGSKVLEMFFSRTPDFSDDPVPIIINVNSFENKQEMADAIDILQRFAIEDMIRVSRKGKNYNQPYEIVYMNGEYLEVSKHYETLDTEVSDMVSKMELDGDTLIHEEGSGTIQIINMDGLTEEGEKTRRTSLDYTDTWYDQQAEKKSQEIAKRMRSRS